VDEAAMFDELVLRLVEAARGGVDQLLRRTGGVMFPPMVHILAEDMDPPYVGMLRCRWYSQGVDAADAIAELGELPSVLAATRLVVMWEALDLAAALDVPAERDTRVMVALDATLTEQTMHWRPFRLHRGEGRPGDAVVPEWGESMRRPDPPLPGPVARLLAVWRQWRDEDLGETLTRLETAGHRMRWASR